jgi:hypothetical protein
MLQSFKHNNPQLISNPNHKKAYLIINLKLHPKSPSLIKTKILQFQSTKMKTLPSSIKKFSNYKNRSSNLAAMSLKSKISPGTLSNKTSSNLKSKKPSNKSTTRKNSNPKSSKPHKNCHHLVSQAFVKRKSASMVTSGTVPP